MKQNHENVFYYYDDYDDYDYDDDDDDYNDDDDIHDLDTSRAVLRTLGPEAL